MTRFRVHRFGPPRTPVEERFWDKVEVAGPDDCWEWTASTDPGGYGRISVGPDRGQTKAHRVSWSIAHGRPVPDGLVVCHRCDNPPCVNPAHLFVGTQAENLADMARKGRAASPPVTPKRGESNPQAVLDGQTVLAIREAYAAGGVTQRELAVSFGVAASTVNRAINGTCWSHV